MKIILGRYMDGGAWPDAVTHFGNGQNAVGGVKVCGPAGFLSLLEEKLGLPVCDTHGSIRIAVWEDLLRQRLLVSQTKFFYAESFQKDHWNTAKRMLQMRDELKEAGALEDAGTREERICRLERKAAGCENTLPRLAEMFRLEARHLHGSPVPGTADRLRLILQELSFLKELETSLAESLNEITLVTPEAHWQTPWRELFGLLRACGVTVGDNDTDSASFQLRNVSCTAERVSLTADRLSEAAEALAAVLKARYSEGTLGSIAFLRKEGSYELDGALERYGLCGTGCRERSTARPFIQLLPLYLRLQLLPFDPENLRQFLLLPVNPLPKSVRQGLLAALQRREFSPAAKKFECWPKSWQTPFRDREKKLFANWEDLVCWFRPPQLVSEEMIRPDDMAKAAERLLAWAAKKGAQKKDDSNSEEESTTAHGPDTELLKTAALCKRFIATADCLKKARVLSLDMLSFEKMLDAVLGDGEKSADGKKPMPWPVLSEAGQFWNGIDTIIWWDFADDGHALRESSAWSDEERHWLNQQKTPLADIGIERLARNYAATAPFRLARRVVTVTPRFHDSEESLPHPLSDFLPKPSLELEASAILSGDGATENRVLPPFWEIEREELKPSDAPAPWQEEQGAPIPLPKKLNPSGLDSMLDCPAAWYFKNVLRLDADRAKLSGDPIAKGNLAHEVMEKLLKQYQSGILPDDASLEGHILDLIKQIAPGIAARYALAENEVVRRSMAEKLTRSFKDFIRKMKELGLVFLDSEQDCTGELDDIAFSGRYDLMLGRQGEPAVLVDMKWSSQKKYEEQVTSGTATQLAAYHYLLEHGLRAAGKEDKNASAAPSPVKLEDAWFFLLPKSAIHAVSDGAEGKTLEAHWNEVEQEWKAMRADLEHGILRTAADPKADEEPCRYCAYKKLCGMNRTVNDAQDGDEE